MAVPYTISDPTIFTKEIPTITVHSIILVALVLVSVRYVSWQALSEMHSLRHQNTDSLSGGVMVQAEPSLGALCRTFPF